MTKARKPPPRKHYPPATAVFRSFEGVDDAGLTLRETMGFAGFRTPSSVYSAIERHAFPQPFKIGRSARWSLAEVRKWVEQRKAARSRTQEAA